MAALILLILLPLAVIGVQLGLDLDDKLGWVGYALYKVFFLIPPIIYCRLRGIGIVRDIFKPNNWRRCLAAAVGLGLLAVVVFWGLYYLLSDLLVDEQLIAAKINEQFQVNGANVLLIAPITTFLNSLLEEFFWRGFSFGLLVKRHRLLGYLLPAGAFTVQHVLFMRGWVTPLPFAMAVVGLLVFALVLQWIYEKADSLVAPYVVHVLGDVAMMGVAVSMLW